MANVKLCRASDVPVGELKQFNVDEKEVLVVNMNNRFFCLDARCTHAGAPLVEGELNGDLLTCPWHGSRFNVTNGFVVNGPAKIALRVYPSEIKDDYLFVEL